MKNRTTTQVLSYLFVVALIVLPLGLQTTNVTAAPNRAPAQSLIFHISGTLTPGETVAPQYPLTGSLDKRVNLSFQVPEVAGDGQINLNVTDGGGGNAFTGSILDGETSWATMLLKPGNNVLTIHNASSVTVDYELWLYTLESIPYDWAGTSQGAGTWRPHVRLTFPGSGLYQFDFDVATGRYQFMIDDEYVQKTVEGPGTVAYYVSAGIHDVYVLPDSQSTLTDWSLSISGPGATHDALPYTRVGGDLGGSDNDFAEEWLPLNLPAGVQANLELTLTGAYGDALDIYVYEGTGTTPSSSRTDVFGGETLWWTADLPAGLSRVQVVADAANTGTLAYELNIRIKPTLPAVWAGLAHGVANNSVVRFEVPAAGLYDLDFGLTAGRYQFLIDTNFSLQKTVEAAGTVRYFLPAGTHDLTIVQDPGQVNTDWSLAISGAGIDHDTLPYSQAGGNLGGTGNPFAGEWLPLHVAAAGPANFELTLTGAWGDGLIATLYQGSTAVYATPPVYGGETFWWTADLAAGTNYLNLVADGANGAPLQYDLTVHPIPGTPYTWSGVAKGTGSNSVIQVDLPAAGIYHVTLDTPIGFAQILVDEATAPRALGFAHLLAGQSGEFNLQLASGAHTLTINQDPTYPTTTWTAGIAATTASDVIAHFAGDLSVGEQIEPQIPIMGATDQEVNFRLELTGAGGSGALDLTIVDSNGAVAFNGTALDGEVVWGTATLTPGQNAFVLANSGAVPITYDLTVYEIAATPYNWAGLSRGAGGWDSHLKLVFPQDALYDFDLGRIAGRYQLLVNNELIQKTVEADGTVTYFVPEGTHLVTLVPDRSVDTEWSLGVSEPGAAADTLPYTKSGGLLMATPAQFNQEWLPIELASATATNFELTLTGSTDDAVDVFVYGGLGADLIFSIDNVYGGETVWWTSDLPTGISRVQIVADAANAGALAYELSVYAVPTLSAEDPTGWSGVSRQVGNNSHIRFEVGQPGLYDLTYDVGPGRFQFLVQDGSLIQKTVEAAGSVRYFLGAGTHDLVIVQDPNLAATTWSLSIVGTPEAHDTLPYEQTGGNLGGTGNAFVAEWLPLELSAGQTANLRLTLDGSLDDGLMVGLYQGETLVYASPVIYGGETFWWTADLAAGVNQLQLISLDSNTSALQYDLTVLPVPTVTYLEPYTWNGVSKGTGANSVIEVQLPVTGTYRVAVDLPVGFANVFITDTALIDGGGSRALSHYEFDVTLDEGGYLFQVEQSPAYIFTSWTVTVSLVSAAAPEIITVSPDAVLNDVAHVLTITGANFQPGAVVQIGSTVLTSVTRLDSGTLQVELPAGFPAGVYSVTVINPDGQAATLANALTVSLPNHFYYMPIVFKN